MRLLLVGAFPYPQNQGSQVYFQEQAIALREMGAEVSLLTYGRPAFGGRRSLGSTSPRPEVGGSSGSWRALDGFEHLQSPGWTAPRDTRAGPSWAKPLADLGLAMTLRNAMASNAGHDAFDAILTHNAEATLAALHGLARPRPPILYCIHTLMSQELSAYLRGPKRESIFEKVGQTDSSGAIPSMLDRVGERIDQWMAQRVDGWLALTRSSDRVMRQSSGRPGALVPPAVPDPREQPGRLDSGMVARSHGLEPERFLIYSGNLDGYQELDVLAAAVRQCSKETDAQRIPVVLASHSAQSVAGWAQSMSGIEFRRVASSAEMQALLASARASLVLRRTQGGFPIKLVNSLAVGTPVLAFQEGEWGLEHDVNSLICSPTRPVETLVSAIKRIEQDDRLAHRLGAGARDLYLKRHRPEIATKEFWTLIEEVRRSHSRR